MAASPARDFTAVFRALWWAKGALRPAEVARACDPRTTAEDPSCGGRFEDLGLPIGVWGTFVQRPGEVLLLADEAPEGKLAFGRDLHLEWLERVAG